MKNKSSRKSTPFKSLRKGDKATQKTIDDAIKPYLSSSDKFPKDYFEFIRANNGVSGTLKNGRPLEIYPIEELTALNGQELLTEQFAPGMLVFGSNCGTTLYAFDLHVPTPQIVGIPSIGLCRDEAVPIASTFQEFLAELCRSS